MFDEYSLEVSLSSMEFMVRTDDKKENIEFEEISKKGKFAICTARTGLNIYAGRDQEKMENLYANIIKKGCKSFVVDESTRSVYVGDPISKIWMVEYTSMPSSNLSDQPVAVISPMTT